LRQRDMGRLAKQKEQGKERQKGDAHTGVLESNALSLPIIAYVAGIERCM